MYNTEWFQHFSSYIIYYKVFQSFWICLRHLLMLYTLVIPWSEVWYNIHVKTTFGSIILNHISHLFTFVHMSQCESAHANQYEQGEQLRSYSDLVRLYSHLFYSGCMFCIYLSILISVGSGLRSVYPFRADDSTPSVLWLHVGQS